MFRDQNVFGQAQDRELVFCSEPSRRGQRTRSSGLVLQSAKDRSPSHSCGSGRGSKYIRPQTALRVMIVLR